MVIEHDMPLLTSICDRMYCLELGGVIAEGSPAAVLDHPRVIESYLGESDAAINRSGSSGAANRSEDGGSAPPRRRRRPLTADAVE